MTKPLETPGLKTLFNCKTKQTILFKNTSVLVTRVTINRTRKQCQHWGITKGNGNYAMCGLKNKYCRPMVCSDFKLRRTEG